MQSPDYDVVDHHHHVAISIDYDYVNAILMNDDDDDGDVDDDTVFDRPMVSVENYRHSVDYKTLFERPYKCRELVYEHVWSPKSQYVNDDDRAL